MCSLQAQRNSWRQPGSFTSSQPGGSQARNATMSQRPPDVRIYLDFNATTPPLPDVVAAMTVALASDFGNPSSVHTFGQSAKSVLDNARASVASLIGADAADVVFTAGGTEADNLAIRGAAEALEPSGRREIITTGIEHEAVLNTAKALERRGWKVTLLPVGASGVVDPD